MLLRLDFPNLPHSWKRRKIVFFFKCNTRLHFQIFPEWLKSWEMKIFGVRRVTRNFPGVATPPDPSTVFGTNQTCLPTSRFVQILPNMQYFSNHWSMQIFFNFWDRPWYSDESVWRLHYIPYLGSVGFV